MSIKSGIKEEIDYVLVSYKVWNLLFSWYHGGPEIRLPLIGEIDSSKFYGEPDKSPSVLIFTYFYDPQRQSALKGILVSLLQTCESLKEYIGEIMDRDTSSFLVNHKSPNLQYPQFITPSRNLLTSKGIMPGDLLEAKETVSQGASAKPFDIQNAYKCSAITTYRHFEPMTDTGASPYSVSTDNSNQIKYKNTGAGDADYSEMEDEIMKRVMEESLKDVGYNPELDTKNYSESGINKVIHEYAILGGSYSVNDVVNSKGQPKKSVRFADEVKISEEVKKPENRYTKLQNLISVEKRIFFSNMIYIIKIETEFEELYQKSEKSLKSAHLLIAKTPPQEIIRHLDRILLNLQPPPIIQPPLVLPNNNQILEKSKINKNTKPSITPI